MNKIEKSPDTSHFIVVDHIAFHGKILIICHKNISGIVDQEMITNYEIKTGQEESIYLWIRRSDYTEKKMTADQERDKIFRSMMGLVRINLKNFDPSLQDDAKQVYNLLENYGNVTRIDYEGETKILKSIISQLRSEKYILAARNLGIISWIDELERWNDLFESYSDNASQEQLQKPKITLKEARQQTDLALKTITNRVTALLNIKEEQPLIDFVNEYNLVVDHYNNIVHEHYGRLHAKTDITSAEIELIPPQPYTGKAVFVIPVVTLRTQTTDDTEKTVELVFTEDFSVSYKNNVQQGTATLIIQGIGKYTGQIVTTFNIQKE
jgi:hypothetical protein